MAQHIAIERIDENGNTLERLNYNAAEVVNLLEEIQERKSKYPLLSYIDSYGDTYFNRLQIPDLTVEIKRFNLENKTKSQLISFLEATEVHEYIVFRGD